MLKVWTTYKKIVNYNLNEIQNLLLEKLIEKSGFIRIEKFKFTPSKIINN